MPEVTRNTGLILGQPSDKDWFLGGLGFDPDVLQKRPPEGWQRHRPEPEYQNRNSLESMACVSFATCNVLEYQLRQLGCQMNISDRALAVMSGTSRNGNTFNSVLETARVLGLLPESRWPWPDTNPTTWEQYHAPIPQHIQDETRHWLSAWEIKYMWVGITPAQLKEGLKYGPLLVCNDYHAFTLEDWDEDDESYVIVFDHYPSCSRRVRFDQLNIRAAKLVYLLPKQPPMPEANTILTTLKPDSLIVVADSGERLALMAGKLRKDDPAKLLLELMARNSVQADGFRVFTGMPVHHLLYSELEGVKRYNLKGEEVA